MYALEKILWTMVGLALCGCKAFPPKSSGEAVPSALSSSAGSMNAGLSSPGYHLKCDFTSIPTSLETSADLYCYVQGAKAATLIEWTVDRPDQEQSLEQRTKGNQRLRFRIAADHRDLVLDLLDRTVVKADLSENEEITALGRHLFSAEPGYYRLGARCQGQFSILLTDSQARFAKLDVQRFPSCQKLAEALHEKVLSTANDPRPLPEAGPTVRASCRENMAMISLKTANSSAEHELGPIDLNACRDLVRLIHATGI